MRPVPDISGEVYEGVWVEECVFHCVAYDRIAYDRIAYDRVAYDRVAYDRLINRTMLSL